MSSRCHRLSLSIYQGLAIFTKLSLEYFYRVLILNVKVGSLSNERFLTGNLFLGKIMRNQLIKLGNENPALRKHIVPVLDALSVTKVANDSLSQQVQQAFVRARKNYDNELKDILLASATEFAEATGRLKVKRVSVSKTRDGGYEADIHFTDLNGSSDEVGELDELGPNWKFTYMTSAIVATKVFYF